jgi:polyisoprenoid-binding protein YceI
VSHPLNSIKRSLTLLSSALVVASLSTVAFAAPAKIVNEKSFIRFISKQMNVPVEGKFKTFTANVDFDPAKPEATKAEFEVDLNSVDLGAPDYDAEVKKKDWFDAIKFPKAKFVAESVKLTSPGNYEAKGKLSIKNISKEVTAKFKVTDAAAGRTVEGAFPMKRLAYNIGEGAWKETDTVADDVEVKFRFLLAK